MEFKDIFLDLSTLDPSTDKKWCMAPFIENTDNPTLTWTLGSVFLENYYVVFDMTPTLVGNGVNQIGYGPINPKNVIG